MVDGVAVGPCWVGGLTYIVTLLPGAVAELGKGSSVGPDQQLLGWFH